MEKGWSPVFLIFQIFLSVEPHCQPSPAPPPSVATTEPSVVPLHLVGAWATKPPLVSLLCSARKRKKKRKEKKRREEKEKEEKEKKIREDFLSPLSPSFSLFFSLKIFSLSLSLFKIFFSSFLSLRKIYRSCIGPSFPLLGIHIDFNEMISN